MKIFKFNLSAEKISLLRSLKYDVHSNYGFEILSGAICFEDESIKKAFEIDPYPDVHDIIHLLQRYRMHQILRQQDKLNSNHGKFLEDLWDYILHLAPSWPGFHQDRTDIRWIEVYKGDDQTDYF